jgi:hypothetical protein
MRRVVALLFLGALIGVFTWRTLEIRHLRRELRQLESEKALIQKEIESLSERLRPSVILSSSNILRARSWAWSSPAKSCTS